MTHGNVVASLFLHLQQKAVKIADLNLLYITQESAQRF